MVAPLLKGLELSPGQLAELRAIDTLYYTQLARNSSESSSMLADLVLTRVREMLRDDQRVIFDRNRAACQLDDTRGGTRIERHL